LWSRRQPIHGTIAETYLCDARGYRGPIPPTLSFLRASDEHAPAMIAAFGLAGESEPGSMIIADYAVRGVHLTKLAPDGSGKAGSDKDKIMIGRCLGSPIVLAPPNDLMGMAVTEGIENGLSIFAATGLGVWAAGAASRMPMLADTIPLYIDCVTVCADADPTGLQNADELLERTKARGLHGDLFVAGGST
jgi:Toprim domain